MIDAPKYDRSTKTKMTSQLWQLSHRSNRMTFISSNDFMCHSRFLNQNGSHGNHPGMDLCGGSLGWHCQVTILALTSTASLTSDHFCTYVHCLLVALMIIGTISPGCRPIAGCPSVRKTDRRAPEWEVMEMSDRRTEVAKIRNSRFDTDHRQLPASHKFAR